ncbi:MAG: DUF2493 domain-containing protein [Ekhidna sp.]|nr:DUF2493 domain-containing protein [Ekhidna sp.]
MRVLVCGGRYYDDYETLPKVLDKIHLATPITTIIHGAAKGADSLADQWSLTNNIDVIREPADWVTYGKSAGPIRNTKMLNEYTPDLVVAFPGGKGTTHMVTLAIKKGVDTEVILC